VGLDSGSVVSGNVTEAGHLTIAVMGEAVARASVLKDQAPPRCIYVGREAYLATRDDFAFREVEEPISMGEDVELCAYELIGEGLVTRAAPTGAGPDFARSPSDL
jgi:class 3 adenylate cyclase